MKGKTTPAPAVTPRKYTAEEFVERYQTLCKEMGFQIVFEPRFVQSKDTGMYSVGIASGVAPMPTKEE